MKQIKPTYQFLAALLSLSILAGVTIPAGLHAESQDMCDKMMPGMHSNHDMSSGMMHSDAHDFGFACACSIEEAPVKTEAKVIQKVQVPALLLSAIASEIHDTETESDQNTFQLPDSYSPPPIFLANESFLI